MPVQELAKHARGPLQVAELSPFADPSPPVDVAPEEEVLTEEQEADMVQLIELLEMGRAADRAKKEAEAHYTNIRENVTALMIRIGKTELTGEGVSVAVIDTFSDYDYSAATRKLDKDLKTRQKLERNSKLALPGKTTTAARITYK